MSGPANGRASCRPSSPRRSGLTDSVRSIPIVEPAATHAVGLVVPAPRADDPAGLGAGRRGADLARPRWRPERRGLSSTRSRPAADDALAEHRDPALGTDAHDQLSGSGDIGSPVEPSAVSRQFGIVLRRKRTGNAGLQSMECGPRRRDHRVRSRTRGAAAADPSRPSGRVRLRRPRRGADDRRRR